MYEYTSACTAAARPVPPHQVMQKRAAVHPANKGSVLRRKATHYTELRVQARVRTRVHALLPRDLSPHHVMLKRTTVRPAFRGSVRRCVSGVLVC